LWPSRRPATEGELAAATGAWTALRAPEPTADDRGQLRLTANGEQVLRGEADRVELLGIDRWIGGTHITPGNVWRWDGDQRALVAP
jgi:hypothetical protein